MSKFTVEFATDNAAFEDPDIATEIVRILSVIQGRVAQGDTGADIRDINGNTVGHWSWDEA